MEKGRSKARGLPGTNPIGTILGRKRLDHIEEATLKVEYYEDTEDARAQALNALMKSL